MSHKFKLNTPDMKVFWLYSPVELCVKLKSLTYYQHNPEKIMISPNNKNLRLLASDAVHELTLLNYLYYRHS